MWKMLVIDETTRLIEAWVRSSPLKNVALNVVLIMPSFFYLVFSI